MVASKKPKNHTSEVITPTTYYTIFGICLGILFPFFSIIFDLIFHNLALSYENIKALHQTNKLHYIIETAPFFLGLSFFFVGRKQKKINDLKIQLEKKLDIMEYQLKKKNIDLTKAIIDIKISEKKIRIQADDLRIKNQRLTDSINYVKIVQEALLIGDKIPSQLIKNYFILNRQIGIVGGDFSFFHKKDNYSIIVIGDCTGHGVPGAFLSVICCQILKNIINTEKELHPDKMLHLLNLEFKRTFENEANIHDTVEMGICLIHETEKPYIEFSGAKNNFVYFKKNELYIIHGEKQVIGDKNKHIAPKYERHTIPVDNEIVFYLFSDGYLDQFGGAANTKFSEKKFIDLLKENHSLDIPKQKQVFENELKTWMGNQHQTDDILVLGCHIIP